MENWTMWEWSAKEMRAYYQECLRRDFPPDERMPLARMEELTQTGGQVSLGFYRAGELAAYGVFIKNGREAALLNYYAVQPQLRGQGVGTACLGLLRRAADQMAAHWIIFEVEAPEDGSTPEETETRNRRVAFYRRGGALATGVDSVLFGVHYHIMLLPAASLGPEPPPPEDRAVRDALEDLYRAAITDRPAPGLCFQEACRVWLRDQKGL
ncbi:GNAT family N-acetyltransferase [Oscillospiraceae bacterium 42-9]